jgi:hypothetical protein
MAKSASSFAFQLAAGTANQMTNQQALLSRLPEHLRQSYQANLASNIEEIDACVPDADILVLKTHDPLDRVTLQMLRENRLLASITIRDPYDILVSLLDSGRRERLRPEDQQRPYFSEISELEDALRRVPSHMKCAEDWITHAGPSSRCEVFRFEELRVDPYAVAKRICRQMGVDSDVQELVSGYLSDREKIWEYNKGLPGRGRSEIEVPDDHPVKRMMDHFVSKHLG